MIGFRQGVVFKRERRVGDFLLQYYNIEDFEAQPRCSSQASSSVPKSTFISSMAAELFHLIQPTNVSDIVPRPVI